MKLSDSIVLYATHSLTTSPKDEWIEFLKPRCKTLIYIDHPFFYKKGDIRSSLTVFENEKEISKSYVPFPRGLNDILFYGKDFLLNILWSIYVGKVDLSISSDPLNTFSLLPLRKTGIIKKLVYYVIDYVPNRFPNKIKNSFYHFIDRQCCYNVDYMWNLSARMMEGRAQNGVDVKRCAPSSVVPMGVDLSRVVPLSLEQIERHTIVYMGAFLEKQGVQLVLEVLPEIIVDVPDLKFILIGIGEYESEIKRMVRELELEDIVELRGYIEDHEEVERILSRCAIGVAPYKIEESSFTYYADPGKPKVYLGCGLPVIITRFPLIAYEIEESRAGCAIEYNKESLKRSLLSLLLDDKLYAEMRYSAITMSKRYNWSDICEKALRGIGCDL